MPRRPPVGVKVCPLCKAEKPLVEFYSSPKYDGGFSAYCKPCTAIKNKEHRNAERDLAYARKSYAKNPEKYRARTMSNNHKMREEHPAKYRTKKFFDVYRKNVASDVTREYIQSLFEQATKCECCGKVLHLTYQPRDGRRFRTNPDAPSIDRVDNRKGYTRDNIAVICWECNFRKTNLTIDDMEMFIRYIRRYSGDV